MQPRTLVVTVTPNPSLDLLFDSEQPLVWEDANRMADARRRPGGQGINVARAVRELGGTAFAVALLGGRTGDEITRALLVENTALRSVPAGGETRTFVGVREHAHKRSLLLNARGPARSAADADALTRAVAEELSERRPEWLACCGSIPAGFDVAYYASLAAEARRRGIRVVVDCDGDALRHAAGLCDLLVPNQHEAERLTGRPVRSLDDALAAVHELPAPTAAITLGPRGALLRCRGEIWVADVRTPIDATSVGAGDCFLAALLLGLRSAEGPAHALRLATAAATASLLSSGSDLVKREVVERLVDAVSVVQAG